MKNRDRKRLTVFVVVGRLGSSLTISKVNPIVRLDLIERMLIFREQKAKTVDKSIYVTLPKYVTSLKPYSLYFIVRILCEFFQLLFYSLRFRPAIVNGVYTLPCGFYSFLVSRIAGCKNVVSVIGGRPEVETYFRLSWFWKWLNMFILKRSSAVTTTGSDMSKFLIKNGVRESKLFEYPGSIDTSKFFDERVERSIDILFVGTLRRLKGPERVLKVIEGLRREFPDISGYFLGNGYMFNLIEKEVKKKQLEGNVTLLGYVEDTAYYYKRAKLLMMPSKSEGLSVAMLEAMACGCVPIVSDVGSMTDLARHAVNSMVVKDYLDIGAFAEYARALLLDEERWRLLSESAKRCAVTRYSIEGQSKIVSRIIGNIC